MKKSIYNEAYEKIGLIKDIFGPIALPFISIKTPPNKEFDFNKVNTFYVKN